MNILACGTVRAWTHSVYFIKWFWPQVLSSGPLACVEHTSLPGDFDIDKVFLILFPIIFEAFYSLLNQNFSYLLQTFCFAFVPHELHLIIQNNVESVSNVLDIHFFEQLLFKFIMIILFPWHERSISFRILRVYLDQSEINFFSSFLKLHLLLW